ILVGLSISVKHILFLFPFWILFARNGWNGRRRAFHALITYGVAALIFGCYIIAFPESVPGISSHVLQYRGLGLFGTGLFPQIATHTGTLLTHDATLRSTILNLTAMPFWIGGTLLIGLWAGWHRPERLFYVYLITLTLFTPTVADQ